MKKQIEKLILQNNISEAKKLLFEAINNEANDAQLYLLLGSAYAFDSNFELAIQYYNKSFELAPNNYEVVSTICDFFITNNCKQEAKEIMDNFLDRQNQTAVLKEKDFDYANFIINDFDAINYNPEVSYQEKDFSYNDLIFSDINQVLEQNNLEKINISTSSIKIDKLVPPLQNNIKPKMLFVTFGWNESGGGVAIPKSICKEFVKRGYDIYVFYAALEHSLNKSPYYLEKLDDEGIKLFGLFNRPAPLYDFDNPMREIYDANVVRIFEQILDEVQPNIVNIHNLHGLTLEIASIIKNRKIVSTFTTHNYHLIDPKAYLFNSDLSLWNSTDFFENSELLIRFPHLKEAYKKRIDKCKELILNDIDYIFAVSNRVRDLFIEFSGNISVGKKICVINQLLPVTNQFIEQPVKYNKNSDKIRFAFIGDGLPQKGVHIIAQALQFIQNKNFTIDIYGRYIDNTDYGRMIKQIDKHNNITIRGEYSYNDLSKIGENTDIMIFSSIWEEVQGLVLTEALAMNIPVIASKIGGIEDTIIDGFNGITYAATSPKALASVINMILENPYKLDELKSKAKLPYTFNDYIDNLENTIIRLVNGERPDASEFNLLFKDKLLSNI